MNGMPDYYGQQYQAAGQSVSMDDYAQVAAMQDMDPHAVGSGMMEGAQSLDQIIIQNNQEMIRRRTYQPQYQQDDNQHGHSRRASMMEFGSSMNNSVADFQFDPNPEHTAMSARISNMASSQEPSDPRKVRSQEDLSLDTRFSQMSPTFDMLQSNNAFSPVMLSTSSMSMDASSAFLPQNMDLSMDFDNMAGDMSMQSSASQAAMYTQSPSQQNFPMSYAPSQNLGDDSNGTLSQVQLSKIPQPSMAAAPTVSSKHLQRTPTTSSPLPLVQSQRLNLNTMPSPSHIQQTKPRRSSVAEPQSPFPNTASMVNDAISQEAAKSPSSSQFHNAYSSSGFDMLGVLMRVATRRNPEISIGPVDLSCAFVVCDIQKHDLPIVYCSDVFERLTGYTRYEILGRNCRFLQAPDGKVQSGVKRKYVDDRSVLQLKNQINRRQEAQLSLINYRKGGQPFMNLLTMIPVPWETDEFRFYVGFQVDLVEQPNAVSAKNPDGTMAINYQRGQLPRYIVNTPEMNHPLQADLGQTIGRDEVSAALSTIGSGESESIKRIWDKVLLENTDDVVHVLSLKGLFLYLSPASRKVLEYDASELVGTALSSVCHPSDIVPVTRELKETSHGSAVNVVYRIRRKHSGYTWFESHGCLHTEQGKGRKCIILVGRERPVYALDRSVMVSDGALADSELWSKISTSGMFLYVSSNVRSMLDRLPEDLVGTSMQTLMRPDAKKEFGGILELARTGKKATFKHDLQNRRGQVLQAQTTIYPGDAQIGTKPTFFLAQTRLLKMTRALLLGQKAGSVTSLRTDQASQGSATPTTDMPAPSAPALSRTSTASLPSYQMKENGVVTQAGGSGLPLGNQDEALASEDNIFTELKTTRSTSWQYELRQMERQNRLLSEELQALLSRKKKRKRRKGLGALEKDCANCHTRITPEWRRGPSGNRDLCNSCGLRWAKQNGRVSPRKSSGQQSERGSTSPRHAGEKGSDPKTPQQGGNSGRSPPSLMPIQPKLDTSTTTGNMPPKIEEGQEPPHQVVLPT